MIFSELSIAGAYRIDVERRSDERGFFARAWDRDELAAHGLTGEMHQANIGFSHAAGTFRGLHLQRPPHAEAKLVRCTAGQVFDVMADVRPDSPTKGRWEGVVLDAGTHRMVYVPEGVAHGYLSLVPDTEVFYLTSRPYAPDFAYGIRHDDPGFNIELPRPVYVISDADRSWPDASA
ncbi:MAG: dTDP-4-dehydrorhamnose 3,5-epimerase family protein [Gammaproteobacteria bacterium]